MFSVDGDCESPVVRLKGPASVAAACGAAAGGLGSAHLLVLLVAAARHERKSAPGRDSPDAAPAPANAVGLAVVIPAHDEEAQISATVRSVQTCDYDATRRRIIVIADNCTDRTAAG